jgi:hypothetical protein
MATKLRGGTTRLDDVTCMAATPKAILCALDDGREFWVPQSQVDDESEVWKKGDEGTLVISEWIYDKLCEAWKL